MLFVGLLTFTNCSRSAKPVSTEVTVVGAMRNVMMKGQLYGTLKLDTIPNKSHLYGLGPLEYLTGEVLIVDGHAYKSTVKNDSSMLVEESFDLKTPFFVYANVNDWSQQVLPDSVVSLKQLEQYLDQLSKNHRAPIVFKMEGIVKSAKIHVVNLPVGSEVNAPQDAHVGQRNFKIENEKVEIVGFFSRKHKAIFTHHNSFLHTHLITADKTKMGHLDEVTLQKGAKFFLSTEL